MHKVPACWNGVIVGKGHHSVLNSQHLIEFSLWGRQVCAVLQDFQGLRPQHISQHNHFYNRGNTQHQIYFIHYPMKVGAFNTTAGMLLLKIMVLLTFVINSRKDTVSAQFIQGKRTKIYSNRDRKRWFCVSSYLMNQRWDALQPAVSEASTQRSEPQSACSDNYQYKHTNSHVGLL